MLLGRDGFIRGCVLAGAAALGFGAAALSGCSLLRANPLAAKHGAIVLVFDTRTAGDLKSLREALADRSVRATFFAAGQVNRGMATQLYNLRDDGHEIGLSGLKGLKAQVYCQMYGQQKYFQDEFVTQVLEARRYDLDPHYALVGPLERPKPSPMELTAFLHDKGFARVIHRMPEYVPIRAVSVSKMADPVLHAYPLTEKTFDRTLLASLAERNEIMVVCPNRKVLPELLVEATRQEIPFATISDLERK